MKKLVSKNFKKKLYVLAGFIVIMLIFALYSGVKSVHSLSSGYRCGVVYINVDQLQAINLKNNNIYTCKESPDYLYCIVNVTDTGIKEEIIFNKNGNFIFPALDLSTQKNKTKLCNKFRGILTVQNGLTICRTREYIPCKKGGL